MLLCRASWSCTERKWTVVTSSTKIRRYVCVLFRDSRLCLHVIVSHSYVQQVGRSAFLFSLLEFLCCVDLYAVLRLDLYAVLCLTLCVS